MLGNEYRILLYETRADTDNTLLHTVWHSSFLYNTNRIQTKTQPDTKINTMLVAIQRYQQDTPDCN
jgi:hypothetical protein